MLVSTVEKLEISGAQPSWLWGRWASCLPDHDSQARRPRDPQARSLCLRRILDNVSPQVFNRAMLGEEIQYRGIQSSSIARVRGRRRQTSPHISENFALQFPEKRLEEGRSRRRIL